MVLQRAPARAKIWGYGFNVGDTVSVTISSGGEYQTITTEGMDPSSVLFSRVLLYLLYFFTLLYIIFIISFLLNLQKVHIMSNLCIDKAAF